MRPLAWIIGGDEQLLPQAAAAAAADRGEMSKFRNGFKFRLHWVAAPVRLKLEKLLLQAAASSCCCMEDLLRRLSWILRHSAGSFHLSRYGGVHARYVAYLSRTIDHSVLCVLLYKPKRNFKNNRETAGFWQDPAPP